MQLMLLLLVLNLIIIIIMFTHQCPTFTSLSTATDAIYCHQLTVITRSEHNNSSRNTNKMAAQLHNTEDLIHPTDRQTDRQTVQQ